MPSSQLANEAQQESRLYSRFFKLNLAAFVILAGLTFVYRDSPENIIRVVTVAFTVVIVTFAAGISCESDPLAGQPHRSSRNPAWRTLLPLQVVILTAYIFGFGFDW